MRRLGLLAVLFTSTVMAEDQATAPLTIVAATIADMQKGTRASVPADALVVGEDSKLWLNKHQPIGGDSAVIVHYMKDGTYEVEIKDAKLRWLKVPVTEDLRKSLFVVKTLHVAKEEPE